MTIQEYIAEQKKTKGDNFKVKLLRMSTIFDLVTENLRAMFKYHNLPESIPEEAIEKFFVENGMIAAWKLDDNSKPGNEEFFEKLIVSNVDLGTAPNPYGKGTQPIVSTLNGYTKQFTSFDDIAIGYNNKLYKSDLDFCFLVSKTVAELLTSLDCNVINSRDKKIFKVIDDVQKKQIEEAYDNVVDDKPIVVVTNDSLINQLVKSETDADSVELLDLTDVSNSDKLQYIVKAVDDVMRWAYTLYGQAVQGNGKMAQQTVDEIQGNTSTSFILPNERLKMRKKWVEEVNAKFGTDITVDFSEAWKVEEIKYKNESDINGDGEIDDLEETEETEETEEIGETEETKETEETEETEQPEEKEAEDEETV